MNANDVFLDAGQDCFSLRTKAPGPIGKLPLTPEMLLERPSGDLFGLSQNAGMGWNPSELGRDSYLILSTLGGVRAPGGEPIALGYHTGHWEIGLLVQAAAEELRRLRAIPFAGFVSDPCDGRTQGTVGMMDSLPYRNDAATVLRRLIRSLPTRKGVLGVATCDKGLPAMLMAIAGVPGLPGIIVPGGVTLPPEFGEDAGKVQTLGARYSHGLVSLDEAAELGCRACASPGGGCQFLGTAATAQVVSEALGLSLPHSALTPSGEAVWRETAVQSARAIVQLGALGRTTGNILTDASVRNAMVVHAAFGGSTNLLLHVPAIAHASGLRRPTVEDWTRVNRETPRLVSVLPNGPVHHPTVRVFLAGGVPEVMLHLRSLRLLDLDVQTVAGKRLGDVLEIWERCDRRQQFRDVLQAKDGVDPGDVIFSPSAARNQGLRSTTAFPRGNLAPEGSVIKSTAIDPSLIDEDGVFRFEGRARIYTRESKAIAGIKRGEVKAGDILVLMGVGPMGTGMEETYQITSALKHLPWGKSVALLTDARFSGVSTGACVGHIGPEALAGGPLGKVRDGDRIRIRIDCLELTGRIDFVGEGDEVLSESDAVRILGERNPNVDLAPHPDLPSDTRLWAALQSVSGGTWGGCVFDVEAIAGRLGLNYGLPR